MDANAFEIGISIAQHICWYHALNMILITNQISKTYHTIKITTVFNLYHLAIQRCFRLQKTWLRCNTSQKNTITVFFHFAMYNITLLIYSILIAICRLYRLVTSIFRIRFYSNHFIFLGNTFIGNIKTRLLD